MKKLSLVALLVIVSACRTEQGEAIHAKVLLSSVSATCVRFEVRDPSDDRAIETRWLTRTDDDLKIAIFRGSLPETVKLAARPYRDGDCQGGQEARTPNGPYELATATFLKDAITPADLQLRPGTDGDGDGYVGTGAGGADCQDAPGQGGVNPGVQEQCSDQTDRNCDGRKGCEATTCSANACVGPPANLLLTLQASSVQAGACTSATVQVRDANGADTRVGSATPVSLQAVPAAGIAFYADSGCTTPATSVTLAAGEGSATFYFQGQATGSVTITATATGLTQDSEAAQVFPGPGNRLIFTSPARTVTAGSCSQIVQFEIRDAQNNLSPLPSAAVIALAASPSTNFTFYSNSNCTSAVANLSLAANATSGSFYVRGERAGPVTMTLTATGFTGSSQNATINPAAPASMVFTGPGTVQAGGCSAPVTIELRDTFGNPANAGTNTTITLNTTGAVPLTYSANSACTPTTTTVSIAQGARTASFHYRGTAAGTARISGTASGLTTSTPLDVTVNPGPAASLIFTTTAQTLTAGNCSAVATVRLRDAFNNPVRVAADTPVELSASPSTGFQFFADAGCPGAAVTSVNIPVNGSDASFYIRGTSAGTPTMSATVSGVPAATQGVTINPAAPTVLVFSQPALTMVAGVCTQVTLLVQDTHGNASTVSTNTAITFAANPSTGFTFSLNTDCSSPGTQFNVNSGQSSRVLYVRGTVAGSASVTATRSGFTTGNLAVTVNPAAPSRLAFQTSPQTVDVGTCSAITTVQVQDAFNNPSPVSANTQITLTGSTGTITFYSNAGCTAQVNSVQVTANQNSASFYFRDSAVESVTITVASTGLTGTNQAQTINPLTPTELAFTTAAQTVVEGACSGITAVETRAGGTPTTVTTPTPVTFSSSPTGFTFYSNSNCTTVLSSSEVTINPGQGTAIVYFKSLTPGSFTLTASSGTLTSATQSATITPAPTRLRFSTSAHTTSAGVCSSVVTVQSADGNNNPVPVTTSTTVTLTDTGTPADPQFKFYSDASCGAVITSVSISAGQSSANLYYKGDRARTVTLTAAATGLTSATQDHTIAAGALAGLGFSASTPAQTLLVGTCSAVRTVESQDALGNPTAAGGNIAVTLSGSMAAEFFSDSACTAAISGVTISTGTSSASFYFKPTTGVLNSTATLTLTAAATGLPSATQAQNILPTVRTGSCAMPDASVVCTITPALLNLNKTLLVFQATSSNNRSDQTNVRCRLSSLSQVTCERAASNGADVNIRWSVAEFPAASGVLVQHHLADCVNDTTSVTIAPAVTPSQAFLLLSSRRDSADQGNSIPRTAVLTSGAEARIQKTGGCSGNDSNHLQVVEFPGASVQRNATSLSSVMSTQVTLGTPVAPGRSILLYSYLSDGSGIKICDRVLRGELISNGTAVRFSRGDGASAVDCGGSQFTSIPWEVVEFPEGTVVQQVTKQLTTVSGASTLQTSVDLSRSIVIGGGQWASGQLHGEGQHSSSELISEMRAQAWLQDNSTLAFYRETSNNTATFTAYVVQFKP